MFTEGTVETAMCLWEWVIENDDDPRVRAAREAHGTVALRHAIIALVPACEALWDYCCAKDLDFSPFDWEFCPRFLDQFCDWSFDTPSPNRTAIARFQQLHG